MSAETNCRLTGIGPWRAERTAERLEQESRARALEIDCPACDAPAGECCDALGLPPFLHDRRIEEGASADALPIADSEEETLP